MTNLSPVSRRGRRGFTLLELLVVCIIVPLVVVWTLLGGPWITMLVLGGFGHHVSFWHTAVAVWAAAFGGSLPGVILRAAAKHGGTKN